MQGLAEAVKRGVWIPLKKINLDGSVQARERTDEETVERYADAVRAGAHLPPVDLFWDAGERVYWAANGFHRIPAHRRAGQVQILANVYEGDKRAAILFAVACNDDHGLPRNTEDKRRAVRLLLGDPEWVQWTDAEIGRRCHVHGATVAKYRKEFEQGRRFRKAMRNGKVIEVSGVKEMSAEEMEAAEGEILADKWGYKNRRQLELAKKYGGLSLNHVGKVREREIAAGIEHLRNYLDWLDNEIRVIQG